MFFISAMQGIPQMSYLEDLTNEEDEFDNIFNGGPNLPDYAVFNLVDLQNGKRLISCLFFPFCSEYCFRHPTVVKWKRFIMQIWFRNLSCDLHDWHLSTFGYCSLKWGLCACGRWDNIHPSRQNKKKPKIAKYYASNLCALFLQILISRLTCQFLTSSRMR